LSAAKWFEYNTACGIIDLGLEAASSFAVPTGYNAASWMLAESWA
jgi:hypothetical protein